MTLTRTHGRPHGRHASFTPMRLHNERVVAAPALRSPDPNDPAVERFFGRIAERDGRALRVVVNTNVAPWRVVSVFFDRNMRKKP